MKIANALFLILSAVALVVTAWANPVAGPMCGWDTEETVLYMDGPGNPPILATVETPPVACPCLSMGDALRLQNTSPTGEPRADVAHIYGLQDGDQVTVAIWRYRDPDDPDATCLLWGHWNDSLPDDAAAYDGDAGGEADPGDQLGWQMRMHTWTVSGGHTGLVIEVKLTGETTDVVWIDDLEILTSAACSIVTPCGKVIPNQSMSLGTVKALYR